MKIGIVTDTNLLKINKSDLYKDKPVLVNVDFFHEYIEDLKRAKKHKELVYYMPKLIIDELIAQKKLAFEEKYFNFLSSFEELKYALHGEVPIANIDAILNKEINDNSEKYQLIELEYSEDIFRKLIDDAINKRPPFDKSKEGKKTDAGFKDALIWNSILFNKDIDLCDKFYFMSCDQVFNDNKEYLEMEFKKFHPSIDMKIVYFEPNGSERQRALQEVINENELIETDTIKLYNEELLITYITTLKYDYTDKVVYSDEEFTYQLKNIMFDKFTYSDFNVRKVREVETNKFEVDVDLCTTKYEIIEEIENAKKVPVIGSIKLLFVKEKVDFLFESYSLMNIEFYQNPFSKFLISFSNALRNSYIHQINSNMTLIMDKIRESISPIHEITKSISENNIGKILSQIGEMALEIEKNSNNNYLEDKSSEEIKKETID